MLNLTTACAAAFANRNITIEPKLQVWRPSHDGGGLLGHWLDIPAHLIVRRPARTFSPVLSNSPVWRMDFEVIRSEDVDLYFKDKTLVRYYEKIADQEFGRFYGFMEKPQKSWTWQSGVRVESFRVNCYSWSQQLKALKYERLFKADVTGPPSTSHQINMQFILRTYYEIEKKRSGTDDYLSATQLFSPNAVGPSGYGRARIQDLATGTWYYAPSDFTVVITGTDFRVHWNVTGPATDQTYKFICPQVCGFVVPDSPTYYTATTPSVPTVLPLANLPNDTNGTSKNYFDVEWDVPMVDQATTSLPFQTKLSAATSKPRIYLRAGSGTGMGTEQFAPFHWTWEYDKGYLWYSSEPGGGGVRLIFSDNQYNAADVMHVGVRELYWPQVGGNNELENEIWHLMGQAGLDWNFTNTDTSGISLTDYRMTDVTGEAALRTLLGNAPPNYVVMDLPMDDGNGSVVAKYIEQKTDADFTISEALAFRDSETPPEVYTMVRVLSLINSDDSVWYGNFPGCAAQMGDHDPTDWNNYYRIWDQSNTTFATLATSPSYITLGQRPNSNVIERIKNFSVKFEGKLSIFLVKTYHNAQSATGPAEADREYLAPYAVYYAPSGDDVTITVDVEALSRKGEGGEHPERIILEFSDYAGGTCKNYGVSVTVDRYALGIAVLSDRGYTSGSLEVLTNDVSDASYDELGAKLLFAPYEFLARWMLRPDTAFDGSDFNKSFIWDWQAHRVYELSIPGLTPLQACELALTYLQEFYRRATAKEIDVLYEARLEVGDTVAFYEPIENVTKNYTVVGLRDGGTYTEPTMTLEVIDYSA